MDFWYYGNLSILVAGIATALTVLILPLMKYLKKQILRLKCVRNGLNRLVNQYPRLFKPKIRITRLQLMTAGIYIAALLLFLPHCYNLTDYWGDAHLYIRPGLLAMFKAFRMFVMGVSFDDYMKIVPADPSCSRAVFSLYTVILYFLAPMLTVGNVLSLFRDLRNRIYLRFLCRKPLFVMSELNARSIALAETIAADPDREDALILFCSVSSSQEKQLLLEKQIDAICLKQDVCGIQYRRRGKELRFFLIGENETLNTTQAGRLNEMQKNSKRKISVHVFSSDSATDYILDALDIGGNLLSPDFDAVAKVPAGASLHLPDSQEDYGKMLGNFSIRRIDPVQMLVFEVLKGNDYADYVKIQSAANITKTVSISILGMGRHGTQLLKTAVWFYQRKGICVELNVFDMGGKNGDPRKRLKQECPELVEVNPSNKEGDACYNIQFFTADCFSSDFDDQLQNDRQRIAKTNLIFIALGDDDADIRAAKTMQTVFARIAKQENTPVPYIYALVHNKEKAASLNAAQSGGQESTTPPLRFVGAHTNSYSYKMLCEAEDLEKKAFKFHLEWAVKENQLRHCYEDADNTESQRSDHSLCIDFKKAVFEETGKDPDDWGDADYFRDEDKKLNYNGPVNPKPLKNQVEKYIRSSYCRDSSLAKALHKEALEKCGADSRCKNGNSPVCTCEICNTGRITEHMRWNAYMRALGYRKTEAETDKIAKLHKDLIPWGKLPLRTKLKD